MRALLMLALLGCGGSDEGVFSLTWEIEIDSQPATCQDAAAIDVYLTMTATGEEPVVDQFACSELGGDSRVLPQGPYTIEVQLIGAPSPTPGGAVLATIPAEANVPLEVNTILGNYVFELSGAATSTLDVTWSTNSSCPLNGNVDLSIDGDTAVRFPCMDMAAALTTTDGSHSVQGVLTNAAGDLVAMDTKTVEVAGTGAVALLFLTN